jgi:vacuolar-type H+-ATPase subunit D/Vma8
MSKDSGANWGYPYYNRPKPTRYQLAQYQSRLETIERQIKALEKEKQELISKINA